MLLLLLIVISSIFAVCPDGYMGKNCKFPICNPACTYNANCVAPNTCTCKNGYGGTKCLPICFTKLENSCNSPYGACASPDTCVCFKGYTGKECQNSPVMPTETCFGLTGTAACNFLSQQGGCYNRDKCTCFLGWKGKECNIKF